MEQPDEGVAADLAEDELRVVVDAVRAVVARDEQELERMGAYADGSQPYVWVEGELQLPAGEPSSWPITFVRLDEETCAVDVDLFTDRGPPPLTLQVELTRAPDGALSVSFEDLHVL